MNEKVPCLSLGLRAYCDDVSSFKAYILVIGLRCLVNGAPAGG